MKSHYLFLSTFALLAAATFFSSNSNGPASNGATAAGAPGDNNLCTSCHTGGSFGTVSIGLELLDDQSNQITEYTPGEAYTVNVNVSASSGSPSAYGFQIIAMSNSNNTSLNSFSNAGTGVKFSTSSSKQYAEHSAPKANGDFTFTWTAPSEGTGTVSFYAGANAVNLNGNNGGDNAAVTSFTFPEVGGDTNDTTNNEWPEGFFDLTSHQQNLTIYPNPAHDVLNVVGILPNALVQVFDAHGSMILNNSADQYPMNISELDPGIYFVRSGENVGRFIKF